MRKDRDYDCLDNQRDIKKSGASKVTPEMKKRGSIKNRIPIQLDAKTTIFVHASKKNRIDEVVARYEDRNNVEHRS